MVQVAVAVDKNIPIFIINGCQNQCAKKVVEQAGINKIDYNLIVSDVIKKAPTFDINNDDVKLIINKIRKEALSK